VASLFCCYSAVEVTCLLRGRSIPEASLCVCYRSVFGDTSICVFFTQHYSSHHSVSLVTEEFFSDHLSCHILHGSLVTFFFILIYLQFFPRLPTDISARTMGPATPIAFKCTECVRCPTSFLIVVCYLFSWRYNPLWLYFHSPVADFSLLVFEVS
jgi:hypothetical protein